MAQTLEVFVNNEGNLEVDRQFEGHTRTLKIDLFSGEISFCGSDLQSNGTEGELSRTCLGTVYGIIGCFHVPHADWLCLLVITDAKELFKLPPPIDKPVYSVNNISVIRINRPASATAPFDASSLGELQLNKCPHHKTPVVGSTSTNPRGAMGAFEVPEPKLVREVKKLFCEDGSRDRKDFYFMPDGNLCSTYQRLGSDEQFQAQETNDIFFWNKIMLQNFPPESTVIEGGFAVRLVHGFCSHFTMTIGENDVSQNVPEYMQESFKFSQSKTVSVYLLSRRSRHRAGRRYKRRGVDADGYVANFVETETVFYAVDTKFFSSFVQIRGSIPLYWTHEVTGVKYQAHMKKCRSVQDNNSAFKKHFELLKRMYSSKIAVINLVSETKENLLWSIFAEAIADLNSPDLFYISYDYHSYSKKAPADELEKYFLSGTRQIQKDIGFSYGDNQGMLKFQKGVHRINCVDCLDRTNIVQRWLAESVIKDVMVKIGCLLPEDNVPQRLRTAFKNLWHENGNAISRQYTGTDALKGDVTKTGKREMTGFLRDGVNSLERRYFMAQFRDSILQCTLDVLTLGYSDEAGFNFKTQLIDIAKKRIEQSDEFWSAWIVDHLESHVEVESQTARNRLFPVAWSLNKDKVNTATIHVFIICSNNFYLVYMHPERLKAVKVFKVAIKDLDSLAFGTLSKSDAEICCLQVYYSFSTTAAGISTVHQITLKPVDLDEDVLPVNGIKGSPKLDRNQSYPKMSEPKQPTVSPNPTDQLCNPEKCSEEYVKSRAIVDKIVEDFAKARSRLSLNIKVKSGQLEVASAEQIAETLAMKGQLPFRKFSTPMADKLKGFLSSSASSKPDTAIERASSEVDLNESSKSSKLTFLKTPPFLNKIKPRDILGKFGNRGSNENNLNDSNLDGPNAAIGIRRQSISDTHLSSVDSILNINIGGDDSPTGSEEFLERHRISTVTVQMGDEFEEGVNKFESVTVPEYVSVQHDQKTIVKRLQSKDCKTIVCFL